MTDATATSETGGVTCPSCAEPVHPGDQFCEACGNDLPATIAEAAPPPDAPVALDPEAGTMATAPSGDLGPTFHACGGTFVDGWCDTCGERQPDPRDHVEVDLGAAVGAASDKGKRHRHNEDGFAVEVVDPATVIAVVCDGVSSTVRPDEASAAASEATIRRLRTDPLDFAQAQVEALAAVRAVEWTPKPGHGSPSCTFLAASVVDGKATVAGMGDCRAYWLPTQGEPRLLTSDDSWANRQVAEGLMTAEQAMADRRAHVISRWLGRDASDDWRPTVTAVDPPGPGTLLLCSDGLWNYAPSAQEIAELIAGIGTDQPAPEIARELVQFALDSGGHDNVTVIAIHVGDLP